MRLSAYLALAALSLAATALPAAAGTLLVPQKYPTIQKALDAAKPYDTVLVSPKASGAAYSEAVTISTPHITLQGRNSPVIDGTALATIITPFPTIPTFTERISPNAITITADHTAVRGLTVQNFGYGDDANGPASAISVGFYNGDTNTYESAGDIEVSGNIFQHNYEGIAINGFAGNNPAYGPGGGFLKGYRLLSNVITGNSADGVNLSGDVVLITGNKFLSNSGNGLLVGSVGVTVSGNEAANNGGDGLIVFDNAPNYNPAVNDPKNPNPIPTITTLNYTHDNGGYGIFAGGTQAVSGNAVINNSGYGIYLTYADFSTISGNFVTGTSVELYSPDSGTGIYAEYGGGNGGSIGGLTISYNQISGNGGDGVGLNQVSGSLVSYNYAVSNKEIGIHLSDFTYDGGLKDYPVNTVTQNQAQHNGLLDARDDAAAPDTITYNGDTYYGDGGTLYNVWNKNLFGTTDPVGLGK